MVPDLAWETARDRVIRGVRPLAIVELPALEAHRHALAAAVVAPADLPPFDNSAMDGFAVQAADTRGAAPDAPVCLRVAEDLPAGRAAERVLRSGEAARIMTGAPLPPGADAIVPVEQTAFWDAGARRARPARDAEEPVAILRAAAPGQNVRRAGESVARGSMCLEAGQLLRAQEVALLLALGLTAVDVHRLPRVGVLSTGDELVEPHETPGPGRIRDSNRAALLLVLRRLGYPAVDLGLVRDDPAELERRIVEGLEGVDFLLTSGGVSVGDRDYTRDVLGRLGEVEAYAVRVKPGRPQVFGLVRGVPVFGLPGNPVSSLLVFDVFVLPALRRMAGRRDLFPPVFGAELTAPVRHAPGRTEFLRVRLEPEGGRWFARDAGPQGSGILASMTRANGYAIIPDDAGNLDPGAVVACQWMHWD